MHLHFSKQFPWGHPTNFVVKVWKSLVRNNLAVLNEYYLSIPDDKQAQLNWYNHAEKQMNEWFSVQQKCHTIREDKTKRLKPGMNIHFVVWTGTPYRSKTFQFAPLLPCVSVQEIEIKYSPNKKVNIVSVSIEGRKLSYDEVRTLAINDGFSGVSDFFKWFHKDFKGRIIHWTNLKY